MSFPPTGHLAPPPAPDRSSIQTNAIILIVVGVMCGGMVPMVFGIIALTQLDSDPEPARRMNKIGWMVFAASIGFSVLMLVLSFVRVPVFCVVALLPLAFGLCCPPASWRKQEARVRPRVRPRPAREDRAGAVVDAWCHCLPAGPGPHPPARRAPA